MTHNLRETRAAGMTSESGAVPAKLFLVNGVTQW
jgi:hypothetical protein